MMLVLWNDSVFSHGSDVCHIILYMAFGVVIKELCPSPLLFFMCGTIWYVSE